MCVFFIKTAKVCKMLAAKHEDLILIPRTHTVEGDK